MSFESALTVMVVDDDFMIARVHAQFIDSQPFYKVIGTTYSAEKTLMALRTKRPDLLVLDVYLPDQSGIELLGEIRARKIPCDVILITAAKEPEVVEEGFRLGIFDYLMKPFNLERLAETLQKYAQFKHRLAKSKLVDQQLVDHLKQMRATTSANRIENESGIDPRTLERIKHTLEVCKEACTSEEIAGLAGVSRSTARAYLAHLVEKEVAKEELSYGTVGRPRRLFRINRSSN